MEFETIGEAESETEALKMFVQWANEAQRV